MKILMQIRANAYTLQGGDTIQMQKTKASLEKKGHSVDVSLELRPDLSSYDVVHLFNVTRVQETYIQMQNAVKQKKPVVLSTIYWPNTEFEKQGGTGIRGLLGRVFTIDQMESLKALAKFFVFGNRDEGTRYLMTHSYQKMQRFILENADVYLPNAMEEMNQIAIHLGYHAKEEQIVVVPNAIDVSAVQQAMDTQKNKYGKYRDWLICVGRIDMRKNQIKLIEAIKGSKYHLLLVGKRSPGQKSYFAKVMEMIKDNPNIEYIDQVPNEELYQIYKECRVSILPSWFETPGLVSLEAASMGCNIVVSPKGTTKDYFGKYAFYCDVMDKDSIRQQIDAAYNAPYQEEFIKTIMEQYTWDAAAEATIRGYEKAMEMH